MFERNLIPIILSYCLDDEHQTNFEKNSSKLLRYEANPFRNDLFQLTSNFTLCGRKIQRSFSVNCLVVRPKSSEHIYLYNSLRPKAFDLKSQMEKVQILEKFLCFLDLDNTILPSVCFDGQRYFTEEATFRDESTGCIFSGLLSGEIFWDWEKRRQYVELACLQFCAQGWMGNPNDLKSLRTSLKELHDGGLDDKNQDFHQQFYWWSMKDHENYKKGIQTILEFVFTQFV